METEKLPILIIQFCSFYYKDKSDFKKNVLKQLSDLVDVTNDYKEKVVSNDLDPVVLGQIITERYLSEKSHFFIYHIFEFENFEQIIQHLNNDLSAIKNIEEDVVVKFICEFKSKN